MALTARGVLGRPKATHNPTVIGQTEIRKDSWGMLKTTLWRHPSARIVRSWKPLPGEGWAWICPFLAHFLKHLLMPAARQLSGWFGLTPLDVTWVSIQMISSKVAFGSPWKQKRCWKMVKHRGRWQPSPSAAGLQSEKDSSTSPCASQAWRLWSRNSTKISVYLFFELLVESFSCRNYTRVMRVATAVSNLCEKALFRDIFHVKCL